MYSLPLGQNILAGVAVAVMVGGKQEKKYVSLAFSQMAAMNR